jgi:hypothetical protein
MPNTSVQQIMADIQALSAEQREELLQQLATVHTEAEPFKLPITPRLIGSYTPKDRSREWTWLAEHSDEYAGQWVALDGDQLLAHGLQFKEVLQTARLLGAPEALIVRAEASDALPFAGF